MKLSGKKIVEFLKTEKPNYSFFLFFGPDQGLVHERGYDIIRKLNHPKQSLSNIIKMTSSKVKENPGALLNATSSLSLFDDKQIILIQDGTDTIVPDIKELIGSEKKRWPIVIMGGDLSPRSKLRKLFEVEKKCAAVPCYADEGQSLKNIILETLTKNNLTATKDAIDYLYTFLGGDRMIIKQELLKLSLYNNFTDDGKNIITSEAVKSCILDSAKTSLDQLIFALCRGSHKDLNSIFPKLLGQGLTTIEILRATQRHFTRLYFVVGELNSGQNYDYIITKLTPPIFFKYKSDFKKQTQAWSLSTIKQALSILLDCEIKSKQINNSSEVLCSRALLKITQMGKKLT